MTFFLCKNVRGGFCVITHPRIIPSLVVHEPYYVKLMFRDGSQRTGFEGPFAWNDECAFQMESSRTEFHVNDFDIHVNDFDIHFTVTSYKISCSATAGSPRGSRCGGSPAASSPPPTAGRCRWSARHPPLPSWEGDWKGRSQTTHNTGYLLQCYRGFSSRE